MNRRPILGYAIVNVLNGALQAYAGPEGREDLGIGDDVTLFATRDGARAALARELERIERTWPEHAKRPDWARRHLYRILPVRAYTGNRKLIREERS